MTDDKPEPPPLPETPETSSPKEPEPPRPAPEGVGEAIEQLLKYPTDLVRNFQEKSTWAVGRNLFLIAAGCLLVFGLVLGMFSGGTQLWAAPLKVLLGLVFSALICMPSLYIFSCLTGLNVSMRTIPMILIAAGCLASLLLIGFTPVIWVFSQSTESEAFMGFLAITFWLIALYFSGVLVLKAGEAFGARSKGHLLTWGAIFVIVSLQMTTALRPIIGEADTLLPEEKKFFLEHWVETMANVDAEYWQEGGDRDER